MRRAALVAVCIALVSLPAQAGLRALPMASDPTPEQLDSWQAVTFRAPAPCSFVCPYWVNTLNHDVDGDGAEEIAFGACDNPGGTGGTIGAVPGAFQRGTIYDDVVVGPAPEGTQLLIFESFPAVDWDTFICSTDGRELAAGGNHLDPTTCRSPLGPTDPIPTGCMETAITQALPGATYILRAYNWSDPLPLEARYCFSSEGHCEEEG